MIDKQSDRHERQKQDRIAYVITRGDYSDYEIIGVTTDPELAEAIRKKADRCSWMDARIEEYEMNELSLYKEGSELYNIRFEADGGISKIEIETGEEVGESICWAEMTMGRAQGAAIRVKVIARDKQSAIKIAAERRAEFLAKANGIG